MNLSVWEGGIQSKDSKTLTLLDLGRGYLFRRSLYDVLLHDREVAISTVKNWGVKEAFAGLGLTGPCWLGPGRTHSCPPLFCVWAEQLWSCSLSKASMFAYNSACATSVPSKRRLQGHPHLKPSSVTAIVLRRLLPGGGDPV